MNLTELLTKFSTHQQCIEHLELQRWPEGPVCTYCKSKRTTPVRTEHRHKCMECNRSFSVLVGTIFEATKLPLQKWFIAIYLIADAKKGISSLQLSRHLNVNKDTAWSLQRKIRSAMQESELLQGIVEVDETYLGGNMARMKESYKEQKQYFPTGMQHKQPILGMYQREGKIVLRVLEKACGQEIKPILKDVVAKQSILITDGFGGYYGLGKYYQQHVILNHEKKRYGIGKFNMSSIEGFWAMLKRAVIGVYHKISLKYLQEYLDEIAFKFNHRYNPQRFNLLINNLLARSFPVNG